MISSLSISNYALIDSIEITFVKGLNIITGETGAGKSIMLGALSMLLGGRADTRVVTDKEKKSVVEATFDIKGYESLKPVLASADIDWDDEHLILRREITPTGRSRSFINDVPVALNFLRDVAVHLVDIHSQHQNLLLATEEYQLQIIDTLLPDRQAIDEYGEAFEAFRVALRKYRHAKSALESSRAEEEYLRYQLEKLAELDPQPGEQEQLEHERDIQSNISEIKLSLGRLCELMGDGDENIVNMLKNSANIASTLSSLEEADEIAGRIESMRIDASDLASTLSHLNASIEADPRRLEYIEERLSEIYTLERKFGVETTDELVALRADIAERVSAIDNGDEHIHLLAAKAKTAKKAAIEAAAKLTEARREVATKFAEELKTDAVPLGMKNLNVEIEISPADLSATGADRVRFLFAFNKNQQPMPVKDTASGGEISRIMLVVKALVADKLQLPSIIFDEIDTGVSGDVATRMGRLMQRISKRIQVIAITHLPQVAALADTHFKVYKKDSDSATNTHVNRLGRDEALAELALMISGDACNEDALRTAASLISNKNSKLKDTE